MKKNILVILIFFISVNLLSAQEIPLEKFKFSLKDPHRESLKLNDRANHSLAVFTILWILNPIIVYEDNHVDIGTTKEISLMVVPFVRIAGEYSRILRSHNKNHFRVSLNLDMPVSAGDFAAFLYSFGAGYFSDLKHSGYFPQASFNLLLFATDNIGTNLYIKTRYTFITQKEKTNIFDFSMGGGLVFYF
jgi:hypothetical protein